MKRILSITFAAVVAVVLLAGCSKNDYYQKEKIETARVVTAPDAYPWYAVIDLGDTYGFIETLSDYKEDWPYAEERLTGIFYENRDSRVYNEDGKFYVNIRVHGFYSSYNNALNAMKNYYDRYGFTKKETVLREPNRIIIK